MLDCIKGIGIRGLKMDEKGGGGGDVERGVELSRFLVTTLTYVY